MWCSGTTPRWRVTWRTRRISGAPPCRGTTRRKRSRADREAHPGGPQRFGRVGGQDPLGPVVAWFLRQPGVVPLQRLTRLQRADLEDARPPTPLPPPPHDGPPPVRARDDDVEHDRPAEKVCFDGSFRGIA